MTLVTARVAIFGEYQLRNYPCHAGHAFKHSMMHTYASCKQVLRKVKEKPAMHQWGVPPQQMPHQKGACPKESLLHYVPTNYLVGLGRK